MNNSGMLLLLKKKLEFHYLLTKLFDSINILYDRCVTMQKVRTALIIIIIFCRPFLTGEKIVEYAARKKKHGSEAFTVIII